MTSTIGLILAGGLRASPLCAALDRNVLTLPLARGRTVLDCWIDCLTSSALFETICIVVSRDVEQDQLRAVLDTKPPAPPMPDIHVLVDPRPWRGTAGVIRDVTSRYGPETVVVGEGMCLPPCSVAPLLTSLGEMTGAAVGVGPDHEPAGVYAFRQLVFEDVPEEGFFDLKEQLLPHLHVRGIPARPVAAAAPTIRLRHRKAYLQAVAAANGDGASRGMSVVGHGFVDETSSIEDSAVVYDSVIMDGARVGAGAMVCRSVIAGVEIGSGENVLDAIRNARQLPPDEAPRAPSNTSQDEDVLC